MVAAPVEMGSLVRELDVYSAEEEDEVDLVVVVVASVSSGFGLFLI